ncbi:helix-turn-helix domain-containing protein [uncultured Eubacterium sp.]|uniref:helix-turn-helix domain-containing protein n=1 Tax=uncultured Eubacterium sp. TaxID=165185 RepID=UPI0015B0233B|nr:helix-turn-helix domain-containing protein [uncultured Eubacterium sp.]
MNKNCSGQFFLLPNRIFDERFSPNEFIVYSFLVRAKDSAGQSFWSVPMIAKSCSMCASTCRKVLHSLESGGYITISKRFIGGEQKSNLYTVNKI